MSNYVENKKKLDAIRSEYTCKGDVIFKTAVQFTIEVGQATINEETWFHNTLANIDDKHDKANAEGKYLFTTRDFEKAIIECARKIAEINTYDLMIYIQREMYLGGSGISYQRAIEMVKECIDYYTYGMEYDGVLADMTEELGFDVYEIVELGFEYLFDNEEEEE